MLLANDTIIWQVEQKLKEEKNNFVVKIIPCKNPARNYQHVFFKRNLLESEAHLPESM